MKQIIQSFKRRNDIGGGTGTSVEAGVSPYSNHKESGIAWYGTNAGGVREI